MRLLATQTSLMALDLLNSNFDHALSTMYQPRSEFTGTALAELFGKMLQSNKSIDIDN